ncbi:MAG: ATPase, T2SS/T4P/T4SS family [Lachnospirales bacterium]
MRVEDMCNKYLCQEVRNALINADITRAEEIRLRVGKNIKIKYSNGEKNIGYTVTSDNIENIFGRLTQYSPYAYKEEINCGYITIEGGYRVGIAGTVVDEGGQVQTIKNISSLNIRIAREIKGCCKNIISYINGNTIIVSPPACGKTTLLRDIVRVWSNNGKNICVIDERNEISGTYMGKSQLDLGERTDIIVNVSKEKGFEMALRSLSPDVIAVDEIGGQEDINSIKRALNSGVSILCTLHSYNDDDLIVKEGIAPLVKNKVFDTYIFMTKSCENRINKICNREMITIWQQN